MANAWFKPGFVYLTQQGLNNVSIRALLIRSTSTYVFSASTATISGMTGLVEISVATYSRKTLANVAIAAGATTTIAVLTSDAIAFGNLEVGQTVSAVVLFAYVGGGADSGNIPLIWYDTDDNSLLPRALGGLAFNVNPNATTGWANVTQS